MWIVLKLVVAGLGFLIRFTGLTRGRGNLIGKIDGIPYSTHLQRGRRGAILSYTVMIPASHPSFFSFHLEGWADQFFKNLGFANEVQTGDASFDAKVYVTCDHPGVRQVLTQNDSVRSRVLSLLTRRASPRLRNDGKFLSLKTSGPPAQSIELIARELLEFQKTFDAVASETRWAPFWRDAFFYRALVAESIVWGLAAWGVFSAVETLFSTDRSLLRPLGLFWPSLMGGLGATALGLFILLHWFKGSSRPHRILLESGLVLALGLPFGAFNLAADVNREMDLSSPVLETRTVLRVEQRQRVHRRRYGYRRVSYSHHLLIGPSERTDSPLPNAHWLRISQPDYNRIQSQQIRSVQLVMGRGRLGVPWLRSLDIVP
jgi:hypothetical protein